MILATVGLSLILFSKFALHIVAKNGVTLVPCVTVFQNKVVSHTGG